MIDNDLFFDDLGAAQALWCGQSASQAELAAAADAAAANGLMLISAAPDDVGALWTWMEKMPVRIVARFYIPPRGARDVEKISDLTARINAAFKQGARGAQIFMRVSDLPDFVRQMRGVRDDLFFNRDLSIGLDIGDVGALGWADVFDSLRALRATALTVVMTRDAGMRSDFVGRVFSMLNSWGGMPCDLHFALGNSKLRIEQALRLVQKMNPVLFGGVRVFINVG